MSGASPLAGDEGDEAGAAGVAGAGAPPAPTARESLRVALRRVAADPRLLGPFLLAGVVYALADFLRRTDPVPVVLADRIQDGTLSVAFGVYLSPNPTTARPLDALVGLRVDYLVWTAGVGLACLLAVIVAGWVTFARAEGGLPVRGLASYAVLVALVDAAFRLVVAVVGTDDLGAVVGLPLVALTLWLMARLLAAPLYAARGRGPLSSVSRSFALLSGRTWKASGVVVAVGVTAHLLGSIPVAGALTSALVAPVHALAVVAFVRRAERREAAEAPVDTWATGAP